MYECRWSHDHDIYIQLTHLVVFPKVVNDPCIYPDWNARLETRNQIYRVV